MASPSEIERQVHMAIDEAGKHEAANRGEVLGAIYRLECYPSVMYPEIALLISVR